MKRIVTITISGDIPDHIALSNCVASILEEHARDIRSSGGIAGKTASGSIMGATGTGKGEVLATWCVEWTATYEPETAQNQEEPGK